MTVVFCQAVLGKLLLSVPYYQVVSGNLAMAIFFVRFADLMRQKTGGLCLAVTYLALKSEPLDAGRTMDCVDRTAADTLLS